ncbi:MAG: NAD(P)-dependent oxidoreductase [Pseudorhodoplanes sp.]
MKVVLHYAASPGLRAQIAALAGLLVAIVEERDRDGFLREIAEARALWHVLERVTPAMIEAAPALQLIQKIGVGVDTIALDACRARGIAVCNMPGTNTQAVAETTLALIFAALRRIPILDAATRAGRGWSLPPEFFDGIGEIGGRVVGLIGYGAIPRKLAPVLRALGAEIIVWARTPPDDGTEAVPLDDLLARADIVSLHVPATAQTTGLLDAARIGRMKRGAILVNTARGALVDEAALADALRSGHLAAAGLDVFADEPVTAARPILSLPNVVATPHVAWVTDGTFARSLAVAAENCRRLGAGENLLHRIV